MTITTRDPKPFKSGEVHWVDLEPSFGSEQGGRRPVLILSDTTLHDISNRVFGCPITSNRQPWPTKVLIPQGCIVSGALLTDQARMLDRARAFRFIGCLPDELTWRVKHRIAAYMDLAPRATSELP